MTRKKKTKSKKPVLIKRDMVKLGSIDVGDFCYFLSSDGARRFGKVVQVVEDDKIEPALKLQCQTNWSFHVGIIRLCAWDEKSLKGLKWDVSMKKITKEEVDQ